MEKIGILTGGGDCPGLNAVIRAVVRRSHALGYDVLGVKNGWAGLINGQVEPLTDFSVTGILPRGGTILGTSRTNPFKQLDSVQKLKSNWKKYGLNYLVAVGGEDTLGVANKLVKQEGYSIVGVPKTIDNDLAGTDYTFGFDTAVQIVTEAIDRLHTTAESHKRVMVVEVMGRHAGWIATHSGMAGGADCILVPERKFNIQEVCALIRKRIDRGREFAIVVVAEGATPDETHSVMSKPDTSTISAMPNWEESASGSAPRLNREPELRLASQRLAMSSAAAHQRRMIACWRRDSVSKRSN
jgi:6-phosphofructokinase 1